MTNGFFQKIDLVGKIDNSPVSGNFFMTKNISSVDDVDKASFKDTMLGLANGLNQDLNAPDQLLKSAMTKDSDVDIHDVMTAMSKAEISVNVATQITSKVIQAYDKIMQISV